MSASPPLPARHQSIYLLSTEITMQLRPEEFSFTFTGLSNLLTSRACRSDYYKHLLSLTSAEADPMTSLLDLGFQFMTLKSVIFSY